MKISTTEMLRLAVQGHGLVASVEGETVVVEAGAITLEAETFERENKNETVSVVLEIRASSSQIKQQQIIECFAGIGDSIEEAEKNAFSKFLLGSFHVLIESLTSHKCDSEQVEIEHWSNTKNSWRIYSGPLLTQHHGESLLTPTYATFLNALGNLFAATNHTEPTWVRVFLGCFSGEVAGHEVLLNNQPWDEAQELLLSQNWSFSESYESIRHFMVALPEPQQRANKAYMALSPQAPSDRLA